MLALYPVLPWWQQGLVRGSSTSSPADFLAATPLPPAPTGSAGAPGGEPRTPAGSATAPGGEPDPAGSTAAPARSDATTGKEPPARRPDRIRSARPGGTPCPRRDPPAGAFRRRQLELAARPGKTRGFAPFSHP
ncbi:hypothetical protein PVAP13_5NG376581 [Panicum virgatum]|uniref:Uncharacterized protein n=1 Tax=Panicum virgatum TaxID=38727 RepID=A0A8T0RT36_PANVG|nr:hypothetical protein PVAP13_5NG376581 [Panicum virgatum]